MRDHASFVQGQIRLASGFRSRPIMRFSVPIILLLLLWASASAFGAQAAEVGSSSRDILARLDELPKDYLFDPEGLEQTVREGTGIRRLGRTQHFYAGALSVPLRSGQSKFFVDSDERKSIDTEADCAFHRLVGREDAGGLYIILKQYYEGRQFVVVDSSSGEMAVLSDAPIISVDGNVILVLDSSLADGREPAQIWTRRGGRFELNWEAAPCGKEEGRIYYESKGWSGRERILITCRDEGQPDKPVTKAFSLAFVKGRWLVEWQKP